MATNTTSTLRDYLQLVRLPNVFTAMADVAMGFLVVHHRLAPPLLFVGLLGTSVLLYMAGMVLNDVWDVEQDRRERPRRPVAAGRIVWTRARNVGFGLLAAGVLLGWGSSLLGVGLAPGAGIWGWRSGMVATLLAVTIVSYDAVLKRTWMGPVAMGTCRLLNVLLGMSWVGAAGVADGWAGYSRAQWLAAGGIGVYITGVTWLARHEATRSNRLSLAAATVTMAGGIAVLSMIYRALPAGVTPTLRQETTWFLLLGLLAFTIVRRCSMAVAQPTPHRVQLAVINGIWSLILLDAAVALLVSPPGWALAIVVLLVPTMFLGRWIEAT